MAISTEAFDCIKEEFEERYVFTKPYEPYLSGSGISKVGFQDKNAREKERDDLCIAIGLQRPLPADLALPPTYKGIRIFTQLIQETHLH